MRRALAFLVIIWVAGFVWFAVALPGPAGPDPTDAVIVPTGSGGRIERGLEVLARGEARELLVTGVDRDVKPAEFAAEYDVATETMRCCVSLGFAAVDTRGNATETAEWLADRDYGSLRLVTADWHMRRAAAELERTLPTGVIVLRDAVPTEPSLRILFLEYHKLLASRVASFLPI